MRLPARAVEFIAARLGVPAAAVSMFRTANFLSGLNKATLPTELIPLNTIQLSRGLLNFAVFQSSLDWVLPFWANRQYDHRSPSFIPRSHLGLSMNVTHRNWTAIGNPECSVEPIVDPRGMVTPFKDGWSVDVWLEHDGEFLFPSQVSDVQQQLIDGLPLVETTMRWHGLDVRLLAYTGGSVLMEHVSVRNTGPASQTCRVAFAVRPFNPEGVALMPHLEFDAARLDFRIAPSGRVAFQRLPDEVCCSNFADGDAADEFRKGGVRNIEHATCEIGLANGYAAFRLDLAPDEAHELAIRIPLLPGISEQTEGLTSDQTRSAWNDILDTGVSMECPDQRLTSLFRSSLATLLMLVDDREITPGPATYHQFWFRDAAYMLAALDRAGFADSVTPVILSWPHWQERSGYFRSQKGEWDANGQVLWEVWHHAQYASSMQFVDELLPSLRRAIRWIDRTRNKERKWALKGAEGLLPPGLSAEHLGLVDTYFWDNFWSVAGMEAFERLSVVLNRASEGAAIHQLSEAYRRDIESSISAAQARSGGLEIPAGPFRVPDAGMIGSCCAWYPLQLLPDSDPRMIETLNTLDRRFSHEELFFQQFIHSGVNIYLSLHIAHAWLYGGNRTRFWEILQKVIDRASPTFAYPEAIHPMTGGGVMGDGHHGWAAAEVVAAVCDVFAFPRWHGAGGVPTVDMIGGVPEEWFAPGKSWAVRNLPLPGGSVSLHSSAAPGTVTLQVEYRPREGTPSMDWVFRFPFLVTEAQREGTGSLAVHRLEKESIISLAASSFALTMLRA